MSIRMPVPLPIPDGKATAFAAAAGPELARVRAEDPGCEMYDLFRSVDDDTRFVMVESWAAEADLEAHKTSPAMRDIVKAFGAFLAGAPVMHQYEA